ncbi:Aluminum-activated malate transporter-like [Rhynchospora pubera]|uniref:Aluminum-activated malate transporter-like n=1 Tax=Rhynchospora pubera TaxID=906938 RepID=A0AAV8H5L1_9POAL|nr:Aluminum-activated malate transporter-like [Rhynchospora pubera]
MAEDRKTTSSSVEWRVTMPDNHSSGRAEQGVEWQVKVPEGSTVKVEHETSLVVRAWAQMVQFLVGRKDMFIGFLKNAWKLGVDDPRKVMHGLKVGLALALVSLFYYTRPLYDGVGGAAMWAIMTVVVVFEYTVGGCLYKGFNRATATSTAGAIALGVHWVAHKSGKQFEPVILSGSVFLLASAATFSRFVPTIKTKFDYGITIFILTYSLVAVSGYRVDALLQMAQQRVSTISIGIFICLCVCIMIRPVWAGQELHLLITRNMDKLAASLEGCIEEYLEEDSGTEKEKKSQKSQGYKAVLNSKASEESQANLARWEPRHGRFGFRHPWSEYLKVGVAMRYTAYCLEALNGCINSDIQAANSVKKCLSDECKKLGTQCAMVLKELSNSIKEMAQSSRLELLVCDMNLAVQDLQDALRSLPSQLQKEALQAAQVQKTSISSATITSVKNENIVTMPLMEVLPVITMASLLIEISVRIEGIVDAVESLADLSEFKPVSDEKPAKVVPSDDDASVAAQGSETKKTIPEV